MSRNSMRYVSLTLWWLVVMAVVSSRGVAQKSSNDEAVADNAAGPFALDSVQLVRRAQFAPQWHSMLTNIPGDWVRFGRLSFQTKNIPMMIGMTVLTGALIVVDDETWKLSDRWYNSSNFVRQSSDFFEYLGDGRPQFGLAAGFALYGFAAGDNRALTTASQTVEAILSCGIVIQVLKHMTGRESPFVSTKAGGNWVFFPNQIEYHKHVPKYDAYPSGHIATALATVTVVAENYPEWKWVRPVGYVIVGLIGVSMGNTGIHWYSDYPLGLALGYSFGMLVSHPEALTGRSDEETGGANFSFAPLINTRGTGVSLTLSF